MLQKDDTIKKIQRASRMKRIVGLLFWSCFLASAQHNEIPIATQSLPYKIVLHVHNAVQSSASAENASITEVKTVTTQLQKAMQVQEVTQIQPQPSLNAQLLSAHAMLIDYIKKHWLACSLVTVATLYGALVSYLLYAQYRMQHVHYWSKWQNHQTLEQLMQQSSESLQIILIKNIATQCMNSQNPTDSLWSLTQFVIAFKKEEADLKRYLSIAAFIKKTPIYRLLPIVHDDYASNALTRLNFVYHLFTSWSADFTWDQLTKIG